MATIDRRQAKQRLDAAQSLFSSSSTTLAKLKSVGPLLRGLSPRTDALLAEYEKNLSGIETLAAGDIVTLAAEKLPEGTEEEKKRKKFMLLLIKSWGDLKSEVVRVRSELEQTSPSSQSPSSGGAPWGKIFRTVKGPLGFITVIAIGVVVMQTSAVTISIVNAGCNVIDAKTSIPISIPGLKLPNQPIPPGGSADAVMPPLPFDVDGTKSGLLSFSSFKLNFTIQLSSTIRDITFDGTSLIGKQSKINLSGAKNHTLRIVCGS